MKKITQQNRESRSFEVNNLLSSLSIIKFLNKNKIKSYIIAISIIYILTSFAKIQSSSVSMWNILFGQKPGKELLWGEPRGIRQDEWMVGLSTIVSNYKNNLSPINYSIGSENITFSWASLASKSMKDVFRPQLWAYHILDLERAVAFDFNFRVYIIFVGCFLFFTLVLENNFWLSLFGTIWIYLSSSQVWWSNSPGSVLGLSLLIVYSVFKLFTLESKIQIFLYSCLLLFSINNFLWNLYPPALILCTYIGLFSLVGLFLKYGVFERDVRFLLSRFAIVVIILIITMGTFYLLLEDSKEALKLVTNTIYPGKRFITGGNMKISLLFSDYFSWYFSEQNVPKNWGNICEASGTLMVFPIVLVGIIFHLLNRKYDSFLFTLTLLVLFILSFLFVGWSPFLSKISLFSNIPEYRITPYFGMLNIILTLYFIHMNLANKFSFNSMQTTILVIVSLIIPALIIYRSNVQINGFCSLIEVKNISIYISIIFISVALSKYYFSRMIFYLLVLFFVANNIKVNPFVKGLDPILKHPFISELNKLSGLEKTAKWAVFDSYHMANLLKTAGIMVFNGTKFPPNFQELKSIDPSPRADSCYNRYGHLILIDHKAIQDTAIFQIPKPPINDVCYLYIRPDSDILKKIGVKYILLKSSDFDNYSKKLKFLFQSSGFNVYTNE
jgi:hypothetical protein